MLFFHLFIRWSVVFRGFAKNLPWTFMFLPLCRVTPFFYPTPYPVLSSTRQRPLLSQRTNRLKRIWKTTKVLSGLEWIADRINRITHRLHHHQLFTQTYNYNINNLLVKWFKKKKEKKKKKKIKWWIKSFAIFWKYALLCAKWPKKFKP